MMDLSRRGASTNVHGVDLLDVEPRSAAPRGPMFVHGRGQLVCNGCGLEWCQQNTEAERHCGVSPSIYDDVYYDSLDVFAREECSWP